MEKRFQVELPDLRDTKLIEVEEITNNINV